MLGERPTYNINENFGSPKKNFGIKFSKAKTNLCLSLHYNHHNSCFSVVRKKKIKFKGDNKNVNFPTQLRLGSISNWFSATESRELSLKRNVHDYSLDYSTINKSEILNIHNYLMVKNNIF